MTQRKLIFKVLLMVLGAIAVASCVGVVCDNNDYDLDWLAAPDLRESLDLPAFQVMSGTRPLLNYGRDVPRMESNLIYLERHEKSPPVPPVFL